MPPRPGDRSPGFFVEPSRCWAFVYEHNLQGSPLRACGVSSGRRRLASPSADQTRPTANLLLPREVAPRWFET